MKNKGFTLVEIIVCLVLITLIGTISVISINSSNKKKKEEAKLISTVTNAANVYYSMNDDLKQKLKDNYGYLVVSIEDLKNNGYLDKNYVVPNSDDKDYSKMVIIERDISNDYRLLSSNNDKIGYIDYIYPYEENDPFIINLEGLTIENFEVAHFNCKTSGLTDGKLEYLDEKYEKQSTDNFGCETYSYNNENPLNLLEENKINSIPNNNSNGSIHYSIKYYLNNNNEIYNIRNLFVNPEPKIKLYLNTDTAYESGKTYYFNTNVKLFVKDENDGVHHENLKVKIDGIDVSSDNAKDLKLDQNGDHQTFSGNYSYELKGTISDEIQQDSSDYENIMIETEKPNYEVDQSRNSVTIKDKYSGIKKYCINDELDNFDDGCTETGETKKRIDVNKRGDFYLNTIDNAGNKVSQEVSTIKPITINLISKSISTFDLDVTATKNISEIKVQYSFDDYLPKSHNSKEQEKYENFKENYTFDNSYNNNTDTYDISNNNTKEYTQTLDVMEAISACNKNSFCRYYVEMNDLLNNLKIKYNVYVKTNDGTEEKKEFTVTLSLNLLEINSVKEDLSYLNVIGVNDNGDIITSGLSDNGASADTKHFNLYKNTEHKNILIKNLSFELNLVNQTIGVTGYNTSNITLEKCYVRPKNSMTVTTYKYDIDKNSINSSTNHYNYKNATCSLDSEWLKNYDKRKNFITFNKNVNEYDFISKILNLSGSSKNKGWDSPNIGNKSDYKLYNKFDKIIPAAHKSIFGNIYFDNNDKNIIIYELNRGCGSDYCYYLYILNYQNEVKIETRS